MYFLANEVNNIMILDDNPTNWSHNTVGKAWEEYSKSGKVQELFKCAYLHGKPGGFTVGQYVFSKHG